MVSTSNDIANELKIPMLPLPGWRSFTPDRGSTLPSIRDSGELFLVPSGRIALTLALENLDVGSGNQVLIPAYHCPSMVDPVLWLGAEPVFYKINADTSPDLEDLQKKISAKTRAILAVHFFGFVQDLSVLQSICHDHGIGLVEDCAHSYFGESGGTPVGSFGDIAIASLRKFFPLYDGGCLLSATRDLGTLESESLGLKYETKAFLDTIEESVRFGRLPIFNPLVSAFRHFRSEPAGDSPENSDSGSGSSVRPDAYQDPRYGRASLRGRMSLISRIIYATASTTHIIRERTANYRTLAENFSRLSRARPLFNEMPPTSVPYVFPLLIDDADATHEALQKAGVSMWRWEHIRTDICPVSNSYSRSVIQLPCHQGLRKDELSKMVETINRILG